MKRKNVFMRKKVNLYYIGKGKKYHRKYARRKKMEVSKKKSGKVCKEEKKIA